MQEGPAYSVAASSPVGDRNIPYRKRVKKVTIDAGCMDFGKEGMVTILGSVEDKLDPFKLSWNSLLRFLHAE